MIVSRPYTVVEKAGETRTKVLGEDQGSHHVVSLRGHVCPATEKGLSKLACRKGNPLLCGCCLCRLTGRTLTGEPSAMLGQQGKQVGRRARYGVER